MGAFSSVYLLVPVQSSHEKDILYKYVSVSHDDDTISFVYFQVDFGLLGSPFFYIIDKSIWNPWRDIDEMVSLSNSGPNILLHIR